ncbi:hypothetical protein PLICRDRAFT_159162 [Plicaturopsis crispa FD-325 SS-3]|nr:hypothetical protein PLICRDRAFT_159162 [Plicaturopsis crispa FD-325 SS-3]
MSVVVSEYPPELLFAICAYIYSSGLPAQNPCLDPITSDSALVPTSFPSAYPPANWPETIARRTLASLCMVSHAWHDAAKPWLWRRVEVRLPRSWLAFVDEVAEDESDEQVALAVGKSITDAAHAATSALSSGSCDKEAAALRLQESIMENLTGPDSHISPDLLSPPNSRDPSPRRLRTKSKSPARWKLMRSITDAIQNAMAHSEPGMYVPTPEDPRPGRFVRHLDFNHFRTIGMRRSIEESVNSRFVTGARVEAILKEMPNILVFGASEYVDGALTLPVLKELFLRGAPSRGRGRPERGRGLITFDVDDIEEEDRERRKECKELEAVDLTGCVSAVFVNALTEFVSTQLSHDAENDASDNEDARRSRRNSFADDDSLTFSGLKRLGLRGVKSIRPQILSPFVLSFPSLTHLDLSGTRVTPELLSDLGSSQKMRLHSLALARCIRLTGESIKTFLISSPVTSQMRELSLYGDVTFRSPLSEDDVSDIVSSAPCFTSGELVYVDLSSSPVTRQHLDSMQPQPHLRSLGLSYIADLPLDAVVQFVRDKAPNVEIMTLISTTPELECGIRAGMARGSARQASISLHTKLIQPLCVPPFSFSLTSSSTAGTPPTRLRVIELSMPLLGGLGAGAGAWRIVRSKGGRGWYADTASGWVDGVLRRGLEKDHPLRMEMERLADANGNVGSGVGWHARKMEILHGHGMLGREDGLYGAVSFAYQG